MTNLIQHVLWMFAAALLCLACGHIATIQTQCFVTFDARTPLLGSTALRHRRQHLVQGSVMPPSIQVSGDPPSKKSYWRDMWFRRWDGLVEELMKKSSACVVVLCNPVAGNAGAVLRCCALLGISTVVVIGGFSNKDKDKALRSSQLQRRPEWNVVLVHPPEAMPGEEVLEGLRAAGLQLLGFTPHEGGCPVWEQDLTLSKTALVLPAQILATIYSKCIILSKI